MIRGRDPRIPAIIRGDRMGRVAIESAGLIRVTQTASVVFLSTRFNRVYLVARSTSDTIVLWEPAEQSGKSLKTVFDVNGFCFLFEEEWYIAGGTYHGGISCLNLLRLMNFC